MPTSEFICALTPVHKSDRKCAFAKSFGIREFSTIEEYGISSSLDGYHTGCRVPRIDLSIHCSGPHLETSAHVLPDMSGCTFALALPLGFAERTLLVTPSLVTLADSGETYPAGNPCDVVVSASSLAVSLLKFGNERSYDSIIVRIPETAFEMSADAAEILDWPYLTIECAGYLNSRFSHYRTNSPSVERADSQGGMWSHCGFFGIEHASRTAISTDSNRRTVGELFFLPEYLEDGPYSLSCPYGDWGLDCAITVPLLYSIG